MQRNGIIDAVLTSCRDVCIKGRDNKRKFAPTVRMLRRNTVKAAGNFNPHVLHEIVIDLRKFELPGKLEEVRSTYSHTHMHTYMDTRICICVWTHVYTHVYGHTYMTYHI